MQISLILAAPVALAAGSAAALGFAPLNLWWLTIAGVAVLVGLVTAMRTWWLAGMVGWIWGAAHFVVGLNWIAKAFTYQAKMPAALGWVAVLLLALYLALFIAVPAALARLARPGPGRVAALAAGLVLGEMARGVVLSGFPWDPLGAAWLGLGDMAEYAGIIGTFGLTGLMALGGGAVWLVGAGPGWRGRGIGAGIGGLLAVAYVVAPDLNGETYYPDAPTVFAIQPNIGEDERYANADANIDTYLAMTRAALADRASANPLEAVAAGAPVAPVDAVASPGADPAAAATPSAPGAPGAPNTSTALPGTVSGDTAASIGAGAGPRRNVIIVWPEGAVQTPVENDPALRARLAAVLGRGDLLLFGGTGLFSDRGRTTALANSLLVLDSQARVVARYDKAHLVPLGEYVPARPLFGALGLARLVPGDYDFRAGPSPRTLRLPGVTPVGVLICYEIIFPGAVVQPGVRPAWLVNVSNDAWYGDWGPPQHLAQARLRAMEEGLPIVRATPTGISAIIDAHGNIVAQERLGRRGVVAATLPPPLPAPFYAQQGHWPPLWLALALATLAVIATRQRI